MSYLLLGIAIVLEVGGAMALRASDGMRKKVWIAPLFVCYTVCFALLIKILSMGLPIGLTYGIWAASGVALTAVAARYLFNDQLSKRMMVGIFIIAAGVLTIEMAR